MHALSTIRQESDRCFDLKWLAIGDNDKNVGWFAYRQSHELPRIINVVQATGPLRCIEFHNTMIGFWNQTCAATRPTQAEENCLSTKSSLRGEPGRYCSQLQMFTIFEVSCRLMEMLATLLFPPGLASLFVWNRLSALGSRPLESVRGHS